MLENKVQLTIKDCCHHSTTSQILRQLAEGSMLSLLNRPKVKHCSSLRIILQA